MAFTFQSGAAPDANGGADTSIVSSLANTTAGWLAFVASSFEAADTTMVFSDNQSNTWTPGTKERHGSVGQNLRAAYSVLTTGTTPSSTHSFTCTFGASSGTRGISAMFLSAADTISLVSEVTLSNGSAVSSITSPSQTLDTSSGVICAACKYWSSGTYTMSDGTLIGGAGFQAHGYKILSASGASSVTFNHSGTSFMSVAAMLFREGAASGGGGSDALSGSAATGGLGTQAPGHSIGL